MPAPGERGRDGRPQADDAESPPDDRARDGDAAPDGDGPPLSGCRDDLRERVAAADGLLFLSDFDGTLAPIELRPDEVDLPDGTAAALAALRDREDVVVGVVSGRELTDLRTRVGLQGVYYAGNHGLELRLDGETTLAPPAEAAADAVDAAVDDVERRLAGVEGCLIEDKGLTASVHCRLVAPADVDAVERAVRDAAAGADPPLAVTEGKDVFELRPDVDWDKGAAVKFLHERVIPDDERWLVVFVGDDTTDDDAFRAVHALDGLAVGVGAGAPAPADCRVDGPAAVRDLLEWLAALSAAS